MKNRFPSLTSLEVAFLLTFYPFDYLQQIWHQSKYRLHVRLSNSLRSKKSPTFIHLLRKESNRELQNKIWE